MENEIETDQEDNWHKRHTRRFQDVSIIAQVIIEKRAL